MFTRHVYVFTDGSTPIEDADQLVDVVAMYTTETLQCKLHFVGFESESAVKQEVRELPVVQIYLPLSLVPYTMV